MLKQELSLLTKMHRFEKKKGKKERFPSNIVSRGSIESNLISRAPFSILSLPFLSLRIACLRVTLP